MPSVLQNLDGELTTYIELKRADGTKRFFVVLGEENIEINEAEYLAATQAGGVDGSRTEVD